MALITCPKCGKKFSDRAEKCPQCGISKEEVVALLKKREEEVRIEAERKAAELERLRKEREAKEAEEARLRTEKRAEWWKKNRKYVFPLIIIIAGVISYFPINAYLHTPKWNLEDGVLTISPHFSFEATMKDYNEDNTPWYSKKDEIKSVIIKDGVKNIGAHAFADCFSLTFLTIPNSVTNIGTAAFYNCQHLVSLNIPDSVIAIEYNAFGMCTSLTSVILGNRVTSIEERAFQNCNNITSVTWNAKNSNSWNFGSQVATFTFGDSVEVIPSELCQGMNRLSSITIPNSVTSIGDWAFCECTNLKSITIPNNVTSIGDGAFNTCIRLTSIEIPNSVTSIGYQAFVFCTILNIKLPERFKGEVFLSHCKEVIYY